MSEDFTTARQRARQAFTNLIVGDDASIDLARAALLIAAEEYPSLDLNQHLGRLETLAAQVRLRLEQMQFDVSAEEGQEILTLHAINSVLFEQEHFQGNHADYYDPQNSFLNRVLERHLGIPITLSLIYIDVGKRLGMQVDGINMPFHFLVRCALRESYVYVDPYEHGKFLSEQDCRQRLSQIFKNQKDLDPHWLEPISHKQLLVRMLANLKHIYIRNNDFQRAMMACDRILLLDPVRPIELRDRGVISFHLKRYARALHDLNTYLEIAPQAEDLAEVKQQIKVIRQLLAMMN